MGERCNGQGLSRAFTHGYALTHPKTNLGLSSLSNLYDRGSVHSDLGTNFG